MVRQKKNVDQFYVSKLAIAKAIRPDEAEACYCSTAKQGSGAELGVGVLAQ